MWSKSSFTVPAVAAIGFCCIGGTTPAYADLGDQLFKLLPDDGAANDQFGGSVAISGATAIVGASGHDDNMVARSVIGVAAASEPTGTAAIPRKRRPIRPERLVGW